MSLDQINSFAWVQTPTKEGIVLFGRQSHGYVAYGHNPLSSNVGWAGSGSPDFVDPSRANPDPSNGYLAQSFGTTLLAFDASQVRQVAQGTRSRYSDGINPIELGDWHQTWPNIPLSQYSDGGPVARPIYSMVSNTAFWDATTQQLIWVQPASYSYAQPRPTLQIFTVIPPPPAPANFRIIGKTP
jgi:hypothetical protein